MEPLTMTEYSKMEEGKEGDIPATFEVTPITGKEYSCKKRCELSDGKREIFSIRFDPHDKHIAAGCGDGTIRIYHLGSQKETYLLQNPGKEETPITSVRWRPHEAKGLTKNVLLSVNAAGKVQHWSSTSCKLLHTITEDTMLMCADFNTDGTLFATGGDDKIVRLYDEVSKKIKLKLEGTLNASGHTNRIFSLKFSKLDKNILASAGWDKSVIIWDLVAQEPKQKCSGPYVCGDSIDIFDNFLFTGSWRNEKQLEMWDLRDPKPIPIGIKWENEPGIPPCKLYATQISHGNERFLLAGGSGSNEARLFDIFDSKSTPTLLATMRYLPKACYTVDFSTQGDMCAISGGDGLIRVVDIFKPE